MERFYYAHDSRNPEHPKDSWMETDIRWDDSEKCYVVTIKTNDTTDANRLASLVLIGSFWNPR